MAGSKRPGPARRTFLRGAAAIAPVDAWRSGAPESPKEAVARFDRVVKGIALVPAGQVR